MKRIARTGVLAFSLCLITACVICNSCGTAWNALADMEHEPDADTAGNDMAVTGNDTLGAKRLFILNRMDSLLAEYLAALDGEPAEIQKENVDFMIDGCDDPGIKRDVALKIYDHFRNSRIMGAEGIAVYLTDTRFSTGEIKMRSDSELAAARIFAEFNRNSLIGNPAPRTALTGLNGETAIIPDDFKGNYTVIYFYDDGCPVCMIESARLKHFVENGDGRYGLNLLAVYTGQDEDIWKRYFEEYLPESTDSVKVRNLWDPGFSSDFPRLWGVVSTPKIFLLDKDGTIIGRNLDTPALQELLQKLTGPVQISPEEMRTLVDVALSTYGKTDCNSVKSLVDVFREQLKEAPDIQKTSFLGALYYDLRYRATYPYKCGAAYLAGQEIMGDPDKWDGGTYNDARLFLELYGKTPLGEKVPDFPLPSMKGTFYSIQSPLTVIYAYSQNCRRCEEELPLAKKIEDEYNGTVKFVYIDCDEYDVENFLIDYYDLSLLPAILLVGEDKTLYAKYLSTKDLENLLKQIIAGRSEHPVDGSLAF